jgi:predicted metal-dependent phosphoesterase TrpH
VGAKADFDLQCHSTRSDGTLAPAAVVARAAQAGVRVLALTDHDTVAGIDEALAAARAHGIALVPAVELSSVHQAREDLHILGYNIDHKHPALLDALVSFRADRARRAQAMAAALRESGFQLDLHPGGNGDLPIGRPHIAAAAYEHPANAARLAGEGLTSASDLLEAYLVPGKPAYRPRTCPTVADAIALVNAAGGVAVWAHPFWDLDGASEVRATAAQFQALGLAGVEVFYVTHTREQVAALAPFCAQRGLLMTGSSDFHGPDHPRFSRFRAFSLYGFEPALGPIAR